MILNSGGRGAGDQAEALSEEEVILAFRRHHRRYALRLERVFGSRRERKGAEGAAAGSTLIA